MVQISAHRGGSEETKPATYEAYERALTSGAEYAEFDIRRTKDSILVVYHDRHAGDSGLMVAELSYQDLCDRVDYLVPRVDDVMDLLAGRMLGHLDLKEIGYEEQVVKLAISALGQANFVATTLEDISIKNIKQAFPYVKTALSLGRDLDEIPYLRRAPIRLGEILPLSRIRACGADWVAVNYKLARLGVTSICKRNGIRVMVWTVDSSTLIDQYIKDRRVDVLITNRPEYAVLRRANLAA